MVDARISSLVLAALLVLAVPAQAQPSDAPTAALEQRLAEARTALQHGEVQIAESRYRSAVAEGRLLQAGLAVARGELEEALGALDEAAAASAERLRPILSRAVVLFHLQRHEDVVNLLTNTLTHHRGDLEWSNTARLVLASSYVEIGDPGAALLELLQAREQSPDEPEIAYALAAAYLRLDRPDEAEPLYEEIAAARPIATTWVLIGRAYRDFLFYDRASKALHRALEIDPQVRWARYYLGTIQLLDDERNDPDAAVRFFDQELVLAPDDPIVHLSRGMVLATARHFEAAIPSLEAAAASSPPPPEAFQYLGRSLFALGQAEEAVAALRRALGLLHRQDDGPVVSSQALRSRSSIHYLLAQALRRLGREEEAAEHFATARSFSSQRVASGRVRLQEYLLKSRRFSETVFLPPVGATALQGRPAAELQQIERAVRTALSRSCFDLGVLRLQGAIPDLPDAPPTDRYARAGDLFAAAARVDPDMPQVWYSLGVARFNAAQHALAAAALEKALPRLDPARDAANRLAVRRMLALASLDGGRPERAAELLADDVLRGGDPALDYAYSVALMRVGRVAESRSLFERLLAANPEWAELRVLQGQLLAREEDFAAAAAAFERALELRADVEDARRALGEIYLRQGRLDEAAAVLMAELEIRPDNQDARYILATVLDLNRRSQEAIPLLREVLRAEPAFADARYLLGKVLLAEGRAAEAADHLEAAARLAPEDFNVFYQLGQALQRLGRPEEARQHFETYRRLKAKDRER